jgi:radical SAM superfamily enzyme YgiQ (UPF0313 family)
MAEKRYTLHLLAPTTGPHVYEFVESLTMIPITHLTLASLTPDHYEITIFDETIAPIEPQSCDLVAISVMYFTAAKAYQLADWYRQRNIPVIMGGGHATLCPDEVRPHCDCLVIGEVDDTWGNILHDFESGRLQKEYREIKKPDLAGLPPLPLGLVDRSKYEIKNIVQTGRGCSFGCDFCAIGPLNGRQRRHKPVADVIREIQLCTEGTRGIERRILFFTDDNIVNDPVYAKELFKAITPLKIWWGSQCALSIAYDDELLDLAKKSGCIGLFIGFETANQSGLDGVNKNYNAASYSRYIKKIKDKDIFILGSFIFGLDQDQPDIFANTVKFCMDNQIDHVNFHIISPTPGTPFFDTLQRQGRLIHQDWTYYQENATYKPLGMTIEELQEGQIWAYEEFFRTTNIFKRVLHYWRTPILFGLSLYTSLHFRKKMRAGIRYQRTFLKWYNREILKLDPIKDIQNQNMNGSPLSHNGVMS